MKIFLSALKWLLAWYVLENIISAIGFVLSGRATDSSMVAAWLAAIILIAYWKRQRA